MESLLGLVSSGALIGCAAAFLVLNTKCLPLVYTLRLLPSLYRLFRPRIFRAESNITVHTFDTDSPWVAHPTLFEHHVTSSRAVLMDLDVNMHKSNSTFFVDADINRATLVTRLLSEGLAVCSGSTVSAVLILAGVQCKFQREIAPFRAYNILSRILTWNDKSLFVVTYFVRLGTVLPDYEVDGGPGAVLGDTIHRKNVFAILVSKYVCKTRKETVSPQNLLAAAGLLMPIGKSADTGVDMVDVDRVEKAVEKGMAYARTCML